MKEAAMTRFNPRLVHARAMRFVGLRRHYTGQDMDQVPAQWQAFIAQRQNIAHAIGAVAYGLVFDRPQGIDYMPAWEVSQFGGNLPAGFATAEMPAGDYAVFAHDGHLSGIRDTVDGIWRHWMPTATRKPVEREGAPYFFERYGEKFVPQTGTGDIEIWIPIEA